mgnify:FL=1|tara:strand:- start:97 stop:699 length:603 start_codon:yes stop_codon:yes gene_type:complete
MNKPNLLFPTPVWTIQLEDFRNMNEEMYSFIKESQIKDQKGIKKSNNKGWHSKNFDMQEIQIQNFIKNVSPSIEKVMTDMNWEMKKQSVKISNMWAIINTGGSTNSRHQHGNSTISAAYYVRAPKNCGDIVFYDPRPAPVFYYPTALSSNLLNAQVNSITPKEGALILFPSYVDHSVNENLSNNERIVISFNVTIHPHSN